jgi:RNA polymerase sigma factor (sigma-70 family)
VQLSTLRDEALARLVGSGSQRAFAALYERYHQSLYRYCRSILRHEADAQDAFQSTFASAYAAMRQGRRDAPLRPWLFKIAHNEAISVLRQRRQVDEVPPDLAARDGDVAERADERDRLDRLVADLRALPERQRGALVMRELSGLSHEEIALALDSSVAAAKQAIFEARRSLAEFQEGRAMSCDEVCRIVSDGDRRVARSRRVRAHLRQCAACAAFAGAIPARAPICGRWRRRCRPPRRRRCCPGWRQRARRAGRAPVPPGRGPGPARRR